MTHSLSRNGSLSILIPTLNEAENIAEVIRRVINALSATDIKYEILVIDDASGDNTAFVAEEALGLAGRVIRRKVDKRGLSLSAIEGIRQAKGDVIVVMDADGSHPPELLPEFIKNIEEGYDLVVASRYLREARTQGFPFRRKLISRIGCILGGLVTPIKDNTSGFFCIRKESLTGIRLAPLEFKIGLEIFVKARFGSFKEIPYVFVNRKRGKSKLGVRPIAQYAQQVLQLFMYKMPLWIKEYKQIICLNKV